VRHVVGFAEDVIDALREQRMHHRGPIDTGQHYDGKCRVALAQKGKQLQAVAVVAAGHRVVGHQHVAGLRIEQRHQLGGVAGRADAAQRRHIVQGRLDAHADDRMIVRDRDPDERTLHGDLLERVSAARGGSPRRGAYYIGRRAGRGKPAAVPILSSARSIPS
jgi:hypothetical protein